MTKCLNITSVGSSVQLGKDGPTISDTGGYLYVTPNGGSPSLISTNDDWQGPWVSGNYTIGEKVSYNGSSDDGADGADGTDGAGTFVDFYTDLAGTVILVSNDSPTSIGINSRVFFSTTTVVTPETDTLDNYSCILITPETFISGEWAYPGWAFSNPAGAYGVSAGILDENIIVIQTGDVALGAGGAATGGLHSGSGYSLSAPIRLHISGVKL